LPPTLPLALRHDAARTISQFLRCRGAPQPLDELPEAPVPFPLRRAVARHWRPPDRHPKPSHTFPNTFGIFPIFPTELSHGRISLSASLLCPHPRLVVAASQIQTFYTYDFSRQFRPQCPPHPGASPPDVMEASLLVDWDTQYRPGNPPAPTPNRLPTCSKHFFSSSRGPFCLTTCGSLRKALMPTKKRLGWKGYGCCSILRQLPAVAGVNGGLGITPN